MMKHKKSSFTLKKTVIHVEKDKNRFSFGIMIELIFRLSYILLTVSIWCIIPKNKGLT